MSLLVVTAVEPERAAVLAGAPGCTVVAGGVGPAAAAATTAWALRAGSYDAVISAGIAGGFTDRVPVGGTVLARRCVAADLGADSPDGFLSLAELGFGFSTVDVSLDLSLPGAVAGDILTVSTVTGTAARAADLRARYPDAVAEAMEGYGVATAARLAGLPFAEVRTIANPIGPRDRTAWQIPAALAALTDAFDALAKIVTIMKLGVENHYAKDSTSGPLGGPSDRIQGADHDL